MRRFVLDVSSPDGYYGMINYNASNEIKLANRLRLQVEQFYESLKEVKTRGLSKRPGHQTETNGPEMCNHGERSFFVGIDMYKERSQTPNTSLSQDSLQTVLLRNR